MSLARTPLILLAAAALLALAAGGLVWREYQAFLAAPLALPEDGLLFELPPGSSYRTLVDGLAAAGVTGRSWHWRVLGRADPRVRHLQAGEYRFDGDLTPPALIGKLVRGEVHLRAFTIVEGWRYRDLRRALAEAPGVVQTLAGTDDEALMAALGAPGRAPEGWFLPETYRYPKGTRDLTLLAEAHAAMREALSAAWASRVEDLPLAGPTEALVLASIIEKETGVAAERRQIAGVFVRRLRRGMRLQTDPTVIYGLGEDFDGDLRRADLRRDTPWNTYTRKGLPPTPIALPGRASLEAAVQPAPGDALFFVARGDGTHAFSATLEAHEAAVDRYQRRNR